MTSQLLQRLSHRGVGTMLISIALVIMLVVAQTPGQTAGAASARSRAGVLELAAVESVLAYRTSIDSAASAFADTAQELEAAIAADNLRSALTDDLLAEQQYGLIRGLDSGNAVNSAAIVGGLEEVLKDLRSGGKGATNDSASLSAQASAAQLLVSREAMDPEEMDRVAVDDLGRVQTTALAGAQNAYTDGDIVSGVRAANEAFEALQPLGLDVSPALDRETGHQIVALESELTAVVNPSCMPGSTVSPSAVRVLYQDIGAVAAGLAAMESGLVRFGVSNIQS